MQRDFDVSSSADDDINTNDDDTYQYHDLGQNRVDGEDNIATGINFTFADIDEQLHADTHTHHAQHDHHHHAHAHAHAQHAQHGGGDELVMR